MIDLRAQFGDVYRVSDEESATIDGQSQEDRLWYHQIEGRRGTISVWGENLLSVSVRGKRMIDKILAIPGVHPRQRGDTELNATFHPDLIHQVADAIGARKKWHLSPERREKLIARGREYRFPAGAESTKTAQGGAIEPVPDRFPVPASETPQEPPK